MTPTHRTARAHILEQSFLLFLAHGFEATSMSDIVQASGMSKGAVYHHFATKAELFDAAIDHYFLDVVAPGEPMEHEHQGFEVAVRAVAMSLTDGLAHVSSLNADMTAYYRFFLSATERNRPAVQAALAARLESLAEAAERDATVGGRRGGPAPRTLARLALTTVEGAALLAAVDGHEDLAYRVNDTVEHFLALVRAG